MKRALVTALAFITLVAGAICAPSAVAAGSITAKLIYILEKTALPTKQYLLVALTAVSMTPIATILMITLLISANQVVKANACSISTMMRTNTLQPC